MINSIFIFEKKWNQMKTKSQSARVGFRFQDYLKYCSASMTISVVT